MKPKAPQSNPELERKQLALLDAQLKQSKEKVKTPTLFVPPPAPPAPPPPSSSSADVLEAQTQARRDASQRTGYKSTLLAGETGGYKPATLLGGTAQQSPQNAAKAQAAQLKAQGGKVSLAQFGNVAKTLLG